jgi:tetratricopeptide (TPR) repeat protein
MFAVSREDFIFSIEGNWCTLGYVTPQPGWSRDFEDAPLLSTQVSCRHRIMISETQRRFCLVCLLSSVLLMVFACLPVAADDSAKRAKIESKVSLVRMYLGSRTASEIAESGSAEAKDLLARTRELVDQSISDLDEGRLEAAQAGIDQSIKLFTAAAEFGKRKKRSYQQYLIEIESVRAEIDAYLESYQAALAARVSPENGPLDQASIAGMLANAENYRKNGDIEFARETLIETKELVVAALVSVRNKETLVYRVEFQTPADEFLYEQNRYHEYVALGDSVLATGDFDKNRLRLFEQLSDAGKQLSREANVWVEEGDYTSGIHRMQVAIQKVVQGLQLLGIPLSMQ